MIGQSETTPQSVLADVAIVFAVVLGTSLFGIVTRPVGFLAAFWPANAALLGLFVRVPRLATWQGWTAAVIAYLAADLTTGGHLVLTTWLTAANLVGVATGLILFRRMSEEDRTLRRPQSVLHLFGIVAAAAAAATIVGAPAAPIYFNGDLRAGAEFWFTTELTNAIIVLPVILTVPARPWSFFPMRGRMPAFDPAPAVALAVSLVAGYTVGGPGAVAFPTPALLWCALSYPLFATVTLTMVVSIWHLVAVSLGYYSPHMAELDGPTISSRLGVMLLALGPIMVASINAARNTLLSRLELLATYDTLTGALTRSAFMHRADALLAARRRGAPIVVLMLDIDRFKLINDTYGHSAGDRVLTCFATACRRSLREADVFGRIGGEEFAVVLPGTTSEQAMDVAERLRSNVEALTVAVDDTATLRVTVSVGVAQAADAALVFDSLLSLADGALYRAKAEGRNRIVFSAPDSRTELATAYGMPNPRDATI